METLSTEANYALQFINQTQRSVFLTGKAGTGKTTLLHQIRTSTHKKTVVVAPTGIAALNANGVTIHSLFQLPFHAYIPDPNYNAFSHDFRFETKKTIGKQFRMSAQKKAVIRNMELLIIDEVSMLRSDLLDAIDCTLQGIRKNHKPFGGVQVLFIGDLLQLPPVVNDKEWAHLKMFYQGKFFFHAHVIQHNPPLYIELAKIYRQSDEQFIGILNNLRHNKIADNDIQILNQYVDSQFTTQKNKGYVTLTTHNHKADQINAEALLELPGKTHSYIPEITGEFPEKSYPLEAQLQLKVGAQIMFVKNDVGQEKQYYNGKMGQIQSLSTHEVIVFFPDENRAITVEKYEWQNLRYTVDSFTKEVTEEVIGTFVHYPIKLAWAITIHKSQGLTFDKAAIDVSQVFMPGQAYVALSRLCSLNGLVLLSPLQMNGIVSDQDVMEYAKHRANSEQLAHNLAHETIVYVWQYLKASFSWNSLISAWQQFNQERAQHKSKTKPLQNWSKTQRDKLLSIQEAATKFGLQLDRLLQNPSPDWPLIKERVEAAYGYFFPVLDEVETALVDELIATQQRKKSKALFDELQALEELQTTAILQLHKAKLVIRTVADGKKLDKHSLQDSFISSYKAQKVANRLQEAQDKTANLLPDLPVKKRYTTKNTTEKKTEKKSSTLETFALWEQKYSVEDIAKIRLLTPQTIVVHLTKLIEEQLIPIESVLPLDRIVQLAKAFDGNETNTLQMLKDQLGDSFSWDELKLFKASLSAKKTT